MSAVCDTLARLIEHDTQNPTGDELALCQHLAQCLRDRGADEVEITEVVKPDGVSKGAYVYARFGNPRLLLNTHIDTVPANRGWTRNPLSAEVTDGKLYGLGSADTKGAAAAILCALDRTAPRDLAVLFSGDEEVGSSCMKAFLRSPRAAGIELALVSEPTERRPIIRHRGIRAARAQVQCPGGHSSRADSMPKPIVALAQLAVKLDELSDRWRDRGPDGMKGLCLNVASISGGVAFNVIPEKAELVYSLRPPPGHDRAELDAELVQAIADAAREGGPAVSIAPFLDKQPFATSHPDAFRPILGDRMDQAGFVDFWTEAAMLSAAGIDAVVIGPGGIGQAHAADEHVPLSDLDWAVDMYSEVCARSHG